jgi:LacI family transcriptional regulator
MNKPNSKRITLSDVALLAGVSSQTVSRVVNNHPYVSEDTRRRVLTAIRKLNYSPNRAARSLATRRSCALGVVSYDIAHYGPSQMVMNIEQTAKRRGYTVSLATTSSMTLDGVRQAVIDVGGDALDGLLLISPVVGVGYEDLVRVCGDVPFVQIDIELSAKVPSVVIDQRYGSQLATQHLIDLGHRQIAEISGPLTWYGAQARHESWRDTMLAAGLEPGPSVQGDWTARSGYEAANELLSSGAQFTALVVGNDQMALGALAALREHGLRVPDDVSVVGFDDVPEAPYFAPPLTTVRQNFAALGEQSVEYLMALIENPGTPVHQRVLYPQFIERQSTRALE